MSKLVTLENLEEYKEKSDEIYVKNSTIISKSKDSNNYLDYIYYQDSEDFEKYDYEDENNLKADDIIFEEIKANDEHTYTIGEDLPGQVRKTVNIKFNTYQDKNNLNNIYISPITKTVQRYEPQFLFCTNCNGEGKFVCDLCGGVGSGMDACPTCGGNGEGECNSCCGSGETINEESCDACGGSGMMETGFNEETGESFSEACGSCDGTGMKQSTGVCPECGGSGVSSGGCINCGGSGEIEWTCDLCSGSGYVPCMECEERGVFDNENYSEEPTTTTTTIKPKLSELVHRLPNSDVSSYQIKNNIEDRLTHGTIEATKDLTFFPMSSLKLFDSYINNDIYKYLYNGNIYKINVGNTPYRTIYSGWTDTNNIAHRNNETLLRVTFNNEILNTEALNLKLNYRNLHEFTAISNSKSITINLDSYSDYLILYQFSTTGIGSLKCDNDLFDNVESSDNTKKSFKGFIFYKSMEQGPKFYTTDNLVVNGYAIVLGPLY